MARTTSLEVQVGERREVRLREMGSAGYLWKLDALASSGVVSIQEAATELPEAATPEGMLIGGATTRRIVLRGEREGTAIARHSRPWLDEPNEEDDVLEVSVAARDGGMRLHDFWDGRPFAYEGVRLDCVDVSAGCVLAISREPGGSSWETGLRVVPKDALGGASSLPWSPSGSWTLDRNPVPSSLWMHRKGSLYVVLALGRLEGDASRCVTYRGVADGDVWTRRLDEFLDGGDAPRFTRLA